MKKLDFKSLQEKYKYNNTFRIISNILIMGIINAIIFIMYIKIVGLYFGINDDIAISKLIAGSTGMYEGYSVYINFIPSYILSKISIVFSVRNWFGVYLLASYYLAWTTISTILLEKFKMKVGLSLYLILSLIGVIPMLRFFTFTYVSYISLLASICLIVYLYKERYDSKINLIGYIISILIFINGSFIRYKCFYTVILLLIGYTIIKFIQDKKKAIYIIWMCIIIVISTLGLRQASQYQYNKDEVWKQYLEFNLVRSKLIDYGLPKYEEHKEIYDNVGWSINDYSIFNSYSFPDDEKFSTENLKKIEEYREKNIDNKINVNKIIKKVYTNISSSIYMILSVLLIIVIGIYNIIFGKEKLLSSLLIIYPFVINIMFIVVGRSPERVTYPHYIMSTILLLIIGDFKELYENNKRYTQFISSICITIFILFGMNILYEEYDTNEQNVNSYELAKAKEINEYLYNHKENVYLTTMDYNSGTIYEKSALRGYEKDSELNVISIGGWRSRTKNWNDMKDINGINTILLDLVNKDNYYFVAKTADSINNYTIYFNETYGLDVMFDKVDNIYETNIYEVKIINNLENEVVVQ